MKGWLKLVLDLLVGLFGRAGAAEQSNAQLTEALKEKEDARKERERVDEGVKAMAPDDVLDRLR